MIFVDGNKQFVKHNIEAVDETNKLLTWKVLEGDLIKIYKSFTVHIKVDGTGDNSTLTWTLEYEKMNENIPDPDSLVVAVQNVTKFVEARLNPDFIANMKIPQLQ